MGKPRNGRVPATLLVEVEPGLFLEAATAAAYLAAKSDSGGILRLAAKGGAYRDLDVQDRMKRGIPSYAYWNLDPISSITLAPKGYSTHGWGDRLDIKVGPGRDWAIKNLPRYGFVREFGGADPGHFQYLHPTWAHPIPLSRKATIMGFAICIATSDAGEVKKNQDWLYDIATGRVCWIREPSEANLIVGSTGLKRVKLSGAIILNLLTKNGRYTRTPATGTTVTGEGLATRADLVEQTDRVIAAQPTTFTAS